MWFWTANFIVAGVAFACIALVVAIRGPGDLRAMLTALENDRKADARNEDAGNHKGGP
jgi:hypothetical protein